MTVDRSRAHQKFVRTTNRALQLIEAYQALVKKKPKGVAHPTDQVRAGVVFAVSAMDAYFTDRFCEALVPFLKKHGANKRLIEVLEDAGLNTLQALEMIQMDRPYRRIRTLVQNHLGNYTTQRFKVIDELFLCLGVNDLSVHAQGRLKRKTILRTVEKLVERRHQIVHEGDVNRHGRLRDIDAVVVTKRIKDLLKFIESCEDHLDATLKV
jgi:hypothetical protein